MKHFTGVLLLLFGTAFAEDPMESFVTPVMDISPSEISDINAGWRWKNPARQFIRNRCRLENPYTVELDGKLLFPNKMSIIRVPEVWRCPDGRITVLFAITAAPDYPAKKIDL